MFHPSSCRLGAQEGTMCVNFPDRNGTVRVLVGPNCWFWDRFTAGNWELETFDILERFLDDQHCYIDIGSWIGPTVLFGCRLAKATYAIEPDPVSFLELTQNIQLNRATTGRVVLSDCCIAPRSGEIQIGSRTGGGDSMSSILLGGTGQTNWVVHATAFSEFVERHAITDCNFIKMDIEGAEYRLIPTMTPYLEKERPTLYLSLHPFLLIEAKASGSGVLSTMCRNILAQVVGRGARPRVWSRVTFNLLLRLVSIITTIMMLWQLRFYKYAYDSKGRRLDPRRLFMISRDILSVVVSDYQWGAPRGSSR